MKKTNKKGFTLMEMLIVVAIVAILVAISIPVLTTQLEKSREATDAANERAAKAVAVATYLTADAPVATTYLYNAPAGTLVSTTTTGIAGYGKGTTSGAVNADNAGKIIQIAVDGDGECTITWVAAT